MGFLPIFQAELYNITGRIYRGRWLFVHLTIMFSLQCWSWWMFLFLIHVSSTWSKPGPSASSTSALCSSLTLKPRFLIQSCKLHISKLIEVYISLFPSSSSSSWTSLTVIKPCSEIFSHLIGFGTQPAVNHEVLLMSFCNVLFFCHCSLASPEEPAEEISLMEREIPLMVW